MNQSPREKISDEELRLATARSVWVLRNRVPIFRLHQIPVYFVQIFKIIKEVCISHIRVPFGEDPPQSRRVYHFSRRTKIDDWLLSRSIPFNVATGYCKQHRGLGRKIKRHIVADRSPRTHWNDPIQPSRLYMSMPNVHGLHALCHTVTVQPAPFDDSRKILDVRYVIDGWHGGVLTLAKELAPCSSLHPVGSSYRVRLCLT